MISQTEILPLHKGTAHSHAGGRLYKLLFVTESILRSFNFDWSLSFRYNMLSMRAFIAVNIPVGIKRKLQAEIEKLSTLSHAGSVRWARPEGIHLTLKFLGEITKSHLGEIQQTLEGEIEKHPMFTLSIGGFGCFPNSRRPRVLWIGIAEETGALTTMQTAIEEELGQLGFVKEGRSFHPHLTLGRVRRNISLSDLNQIQDAVEMYVVGQIGQFEVREIHLVRSILKPSGAEYSSLGEYSLGRKGVG